MADISETNEYQDFKHWLRCFDRDLKKAWKKKRNQDPVHAALDDSLSDEVINLRCAKERVLTALVLMCEKVEFSQGGEPLAN